jgi:hypothetical protein
MHESKQASGLIESENILCTTKRVMVQSGLSVSCLDGMIKSDVVIDVYACSAGFGNDYKTLAVANQMQEPRSSK